jgi:hypothetical protein
LEGHTCALNLSSRCRNINLPSIVYAFRPRLRDLRLSAGRIFTCLIVTHAGILTRMRSTTRHRMASTRHATLVYHDIKDVIRCFGTGLEFPIIYGAALLDQ